MEISHSQDTCPAKQKTSLCKCSSWTPRDESLSHKSESIPGFRRIFRSIFRDPFGAKQSKNTILTLRFCRS